MPFGSFKSLLNVKIVNFSFQSDSELVVESFSEDEDGDKTVDHECKKEPDLSVSNKELDPSTVVAPVEIQNLLHRKEELEKRHRRQERHRQRVQVGHSSVVFLCWNCHLLRSSCCGLNLIAAHQNVRVLYVGIIKK